LARKLIGFILRHGETVLNADNRFRGLSNPSLDENGEKQAKAASKFLKGTPIKRIICSPFYRAHTTAKEVASNLGLDISQDGALFPLDVGFMTGEDKDKYRAILQFFVNNPHLEIPDGESLDDFEDRMAEFFSRELKAAEKEMTLFVCHTSNIIALNNLIAGNRAIEPEMGDSVEPGGIMAIYGNNDEYATEVVFGGDKHSELGVS
jgi:probable phosphoglycerate mutase